MAGLQAWTDRPNTLVAVQRRYRLSAAEAFPALPRTEGAASHDPSKKQSRFNKPLFQIYQRLPPISVKLIASVLCSRTQNLAASNDYINIKKEG